MSAVTAVLYCIPFILRIPLAFIWDAIISLLWIALFGIFGQVRSPSCLFPPSAIAVETNLCSTDVHPRKPRRRCRYPAHEECCLGGSYQRFSLAHQYGRYGGTLAETEAFSEVCSGESAGLNRFRARKNNFHKMIPSGWAGRGGVKELIA
jgi:hypothetical protein